MHANTHLHTHKHTHAFSLYVKISCKSLTMDYRGSWMLCFRGSLRCGDAVWCSSLHIPLSFYSVTIYCSIYTILCRIYTYISYEPLFQYLLSVFLSPPHAFDSKLQSDSSSVNLLLSCITVTGSGRQERSHDWLRASIAITLWSLLALAAAVIPTWPKIAAALGDEMQRPRSASLHLTLHLGLK